MITQIIIAIGVLLVGFYARYQVSAWRKRVRKETEEIGETTSRVFKNLKEGAEKQIEFMDDMPGMTEDERRVKNNLEESLEASEKFIQEEVKDVEKETD